MLPVVRGTIFCCLFLILISTAKCVDYQLSEDDISYAKSINEEMKNLDLEGFQKLTKHTEFLTGKLESSEKCEGCVSAVQEVSSKKHDIENGIIVFVSFSMPDIALKQLSDDASKYGATLVLRGIHQDSFLKTKDKILEISSDGLHLNIDPNLFELYKIEKVPTFVLVEKDREISRLSGNVTLSFAQEKLSTGEK